jgi:hypothetical protein
MEEKMKKILPILAVAFLAGCTVPGDSSVTNSLPTSTSEETTSLVTSSEEVVSSEELISSEVTSSEEVSSSENITSSEVTSSSEAIPSSSEENSSSETTIEPDLVKVPGINALALLEVLDEANLVEAYIFSTYHGGSLIHVATPTGTVSVSYFSAAQEIKDQAALLNAGQYINVTGLVTISTGGDQARAKHIMPTVISVVTQPSWLFDGFISAKTVDMADGFKAFADDIITNDLGVVYTFTNVKFMTVGTATLTTTGYDYLNYTAVTAGKNEVLTSATNYYRIGFYHFELDTNLFNTTDTYTIQTFLVGTNQNIPWSGTSNVILRLGGFVNILN